MMRLNVVERSHGIPQKIQLGIIRLLSGRRALDIIRTLLYRPRFFGGPFRAWTHAVMRGPSEWTVGERELLAAFTSRLNRCRF